MIKNTISWEGLKNLAAQYKAAKGADKAQYTLPYGMVRVVNGHEKFIVDDRNPIIAMNEIRHWKDWE